jgi:fructose-1,6-bisphosphatase/inositol monophosphatase family enzyme
MRVSEKESQQGVTPQLQAAILDTAKSAAREAGGLLLARFREAQTVEVAERHDIKLEVDRLAEARLLSVIRGAWPDHVVLSEEAGLIRGEGEFLWVIDPLDGSVNYAQGLPLFSLCVACHHLPEGSFTTSSIDGLASLGRPLVAVVYAPLLGEWFIASSGNGVTVNGVAARIALTAGLGEAVVSTSFGSDERAQGRLREINARLGRAVRKLRSFGSTALDLAYVACGRLSAVYHPSIRSWDFLSGRLLIEEAGGILEAQPYGEHRWELLASAPAVHLPLRRIIFQ